MDSDSKKRYIISTKVPSVSDDRLQVGLWYAGIIATNTELVGGKKGRNDEDALYKKQNENFVNWCNKNYLCLNVDALYKKQNENFVNWGNKNYLCLNVSKTKEMCTDFRKNQRCPKPVYIKGEAVERVGTYKYLGVVFDRRLNWKENINSVVKKVNPRMYFMRKLRSFGVNSDMLVTFYNAVICSLIMFGSVCKGGNISKFYKGSWERL